MQIKWGNTTKQGSLEHFTTHLWLSTFLLLLVLEYWNFVRLERSLHEMIERFFSLNGIIHSSRFQLTSVSLRGPLNAVHKCGQKQAHTLFLYSTLHCLSKAGWLRFQLSNSGLLRNFYNLKKSIILFGPTLASITAMPTSK